MCINQLLDLGFLVGSGVDGKPTISHPAGRKAITFDPKRHARDVIADYMKELRRDAELLDHMESRTHSLFWLGPGANHFGYHQREGTLRGVLEADRGPR